MDELQIRYSDEKNDGKYLFEWLSDKENLKWFPMETKDEIYKSSKNWIGYSRYKASLTALIKDKPVGIATLFLMPYKKVAHHAMFYLIVDRKHQRQGIGASLLKNTLNLAEKYFKLESVHAEIFENCPIEILLKKNGFEQFAYQKDFMQFEDKSYARVMFEHFFKRDGNNE